MGRGQSEAQLVRPPLPPAAASKGPVGSRPAGTCRPLSFSAFCPLIIPFSTHSSSILSLLLLPLPPCRLSPAVPSFLLFLPSPLCTPTPGRKKRLNPHAFTKQVHALRRQHRYECLPRVNNPISHIKGVSGVVLYLESPCWARGEEPEAGVSPPAGSGLFGVDFCFMPRASAHRLHNYGATLMILRFLWLLIYER